VTSSSILISSLPHERGMPELRRILCPTDFSEFSDLAFRYAQSLARHYRAKLFVQHVVELWRHPEAAFAPARHYEEFREYLLHKGDEDLQRFAKNHADNEIQPERVAEQGVAADSILSLADAQKVDLIVMGTHGRRGLDRLMVGSVTERVLRKASYPVLAVHKPSPDFLSSREQEDPVHLNRILFCTDFSEKSQRALGHALSLTAEYDAELTLLHVLEDIPDRSSIEEAMTAAMEELVELIPPERPKGGTIKTMVRRGEAYEQIIQLALEGRSDLVIMAVRGRGALNLSVFGSTTYRVIQLGPCPVLAVHV
jgi:nucleotide-binding universal stress UspA family protein